jgi:hypothetical protein
LSASRIATSDTSAGRALAEQVHADQHVEVALPQVVQDLDPLERLDLAVQVPAADAGLLDVRRQVLRQALGQRRHQHPLAALDALLDRGQQVRHLALGRVDLDLRVDQPVGRMTCSTTSPPVCSSSILPGVAET